MTEQEREKHALCVNCGASTAMGFGRFVNRIPVCNSVEENKETGWEYPDGTHLCELCGRAITARTLTTTCMECNTEAMQVPDDPRNVNGAEEIKKHYHCRNGHEWSVAFTPSDYEMIKGAED